MIDTVIGVYTKNKSVYADYPAIVECEGELEILDGEIKEVDKQYIQAASGKTAEKNSAFEEVLKTALPIKAALSAYAEKNKLEELKSKTALSESDLKRLSPAEIITRSEVYIKEARSILNNLSDYKITEEKLALLETKINALKIKNTEKGTGYTSKSALRKTLTIKFKAVNILLNKRYDELIETVKEEHLELYNQYWAARIIKDLGGSRSKEDETNNAAADTNAVSTDTTKSS
jgi:hypothetical protein